MRSPGTVTWLRASDRGSAELLGTCLEAASPTELLGRVGPNLADPQGAPWPPFVVLAARGAEVVAVVHGPVEVMVEHEGSEDRLYGGDEAGSWLTRLLHAVSAVRVGKTGDDEGPADLRLGVIKANGFVLLPSGAPVAALGGAATGGPGAQGGPLGRPAGETAAASSSPRADDLTVADQPAFDADATVADRLDGELSGGAGAGAPAAPAIGKLTWDNGEVHEFSGAVLVGRDVTLDEGVMEGQLGSMVPGGQNDSMSRVHAELRPHGDEVVVLDRGSTNGTFLWDDASKVWQRLVAGEPQTLRPGAVLAFGERTATFEPAVPR